MQRGLDYGDNAVEDYEAGYWNFIEDTANAWYDAQSRRRQDRRRDQGLPRAVRRWDRYDFDGDGNFNEPDGYIDHFQAVHAGEGEEAGGGAQGEDAIWSHRWYANSDDSGTHRPDAANQLGGAPDRRHRLLDRRLHRRAGERRPRRVRARVRPRPRPARPLRHRRRRERHRLLDADVGRLVAQPRHRPTSAPRPATWARGRSSSSAGSTTSRSTSAVRHARQAQPGRPATARSAQAVVVNLPDKHASRPIHHPALGHPRVVDRLRRRPEHHADPPLDLTGRLVRSVSAKAWYDIEAGYDYLYGEFSTDGGATWTAGRRRRRRHEQRQVDR